MTVLALVSTLLAGISTYNYLLFHTLVEGFAVVVGCLMLATAWYTYPYCRNAFLMFLACGYFWIGMVDLAHTLAYKGMAIFPGTSANPATQLWLVARYWQALLLLAAPLFLGRTLRQMPTFLAFGGVFVLFGGAVASGYFPDAYIDGAGLTAFKVWSEYAIVGILGLAYWHLWRRRDRLDRGTLTRMAAAIALTIAAELAFTSYVGVYDAANLAGHILKLFSFWVLFEAIIRTSLEEPYLRLEERVAVRTTELAESEERFRALFHASPIALAISRLEDGRILDVNEAWLALFGFAREEVIGQATIDLGIWPDGDTRSVVANIAAREGVRNREVIHWRKDRTLVPILLSMEKVMLGGTAYVIGVNVDISEQKAFERHLEDLNDSLTAATRQAEAASAAKSDFLAKMSHEMRTPLNGIIGMCELALLNVRSRKAREYVELSKRAAWQLAGLITDTVDLAKIEAGRVEIAKAPFSLGDEVASALAPLRAMAEESGLELSCEIAAGVPTVVVGDASRLRQVLTNLVGNAVKFTPGGGVVRVSVRRDDGLVFEVADSGIGIPPDQLDRIFESFAQAGRPVHAKYGSSGLGLTITRQLVELMGGRIWVESTVGKGSRFSFVLPLGPKTEAEAIEIASASE